MVQRCCSWFTAVPMLLATMVALAQTPAEPVVAPPRYTFSWPLDGANPRPRGGTTRGAPVTLELAPSAAWRALQEGGLTAQERDRRAILAMAGTYRVDFDFLEITGVAPSD